MLFTVDCRLIRHATTLLTRDKHLDTLKQTSCKTTRRGRQVPSLRRLVALGGWDGGASEHITACVCCAAEMPHSEEPVHLTPWMTQKTQTSLHNMTIGLMKNIRRT
ncbi:hypothetical protein GWK47_055282 [Chionoecetes opilio]|uniref:Uncharacterized protein n=1 Tax=Chionoecetes opilio TaxID=41210 RepID=A0A8J4Y488_CHIOP|nr:hypothetical protein GWK47_055282 [Chionoecetes opilio]